MRADERKQHLNIQIARRLIHLRARRDLRNGPAPRRTQTEVAEALGLGVGAVGAIESGRRKLSAAELVMLAEYFEVPITELVPT